VIKQRSFAFALVVGLALILPARAHAQTESMIQMQQQIDQLTRKVQELENANQQVHGLDQRVRVIDRKLELSQQAEVEKARLTPIVHAGPEGFFLNSPDDGKTFSLHLGMLLEADSRFYFTQTKPTGSEFLIRRARPIFEGTIDQYYDFKLMPDFGQGTTVLYDAYADIHYWPWLRFRAGKFKEPVGLEELQEDRNLKFVERALPSDLVPNRSIGVDLHGLVGQGWLDYAVGVFNSVPDNTATIDSDTTDAKDFVARLFFYPFVATQYEFAQKLGLGISGTYGDQAAATIDTYKSAGQYTFFTYTSGTVATGPHYRYSPQADYYWGPFGLLGEYVQNTQQLAKPVTIATKVYLAKPRYYNDQSWQIAASWLLTGEDNSYAQIVPHRNFDPTDPINGGLGAWEIAARIDQLLIDRDVYNYGLASKSTAANEAFEFSLGVNWYLDRNVKFMVDYEHTGYHYGATEHRDLTDESAILNELQIAF
jgi:phosphate-selective porin OprO and OprP